MIVLALGACSSDDGDVDSGTQVSSPASATSVPQATETAITVDRVTTGTNGRDATEEDYVEAIVERFEASDSGLTDAEARCLAEGTVDLVGVDQLREAGITPDGLRADGPSPLPQLLETDAEADDFIDMTLDCVDIGDLLVDEMTEGIPVSVAPADLECIADRLESSDAVRALLRAEFLEDEGAADTALDLEEAITSSFDECGVDLEALMGTGS